MPTVSVKVQIPDGWELACDEMRCPKNGEWFLSHSGDPEQANIDFFNSRFPILRKWKQPEFLKPGWIAKDSNGLWYWFQNKPSLGSMQWESDFSACNLAAFKWTPPACDWKQSKRMIE